MSAGVRRGLLAVVAVVAIVWPALLSDFSRSLATDGLIFGLIVLSLVLLTGFVGQTSFCQYSFAAVGAFTVGSLVAGHHWSFWLAMPLGVTAAAVVGALVAIPALRLTGLFLTILTVAVALFFDRFVLAPGTWDSFSGGLSPWVVGRPAFVGINLDTSYRFYLFVLGVFALCSLLVWNFRRGKTGRVLRAIRDAEIAASTLGINLTAWKLAAFATSAGLAGLAGSLLAVSVGSVSTGGYDFIHSLGVAAVATVMGVSSVASAAAGGLFLVYGPEILRRLHVSPQWFNLVTGALLIVQLIVTPDGMVTDVQHKLSHLLGRRAKPASPAEINLASAAGTEDAGSAVDASPVRAGGAQ
jgi:ABC-type branched-subunit amino acid transport system permease subunit